MSIREILESAISSTIDSILRQSDERGHITGSEVRTLIQLYEAINKAPIDTAAAGTNEVVSLDTEQLMALAQSVPRMKNVTRRLTAPSADGQDQGQDGEKKDGPGGPKTKRARSGS